MTVASLPRCRRCRRVPKISEILLAVSRHRPSSQLRSNSLWMGKLRLSGALAQNFLAHHWNAEHLTEEVHHLLGPRQGAEVTVNDNAVEAVVNKRQEVAEQLGEYFHGKHR